MTDTDCEPEAVPEAEDETPTQTESEPEGGPFLITTKTKDYLGRALSNIAVDARDFLGRSTTAADKDFIGRLLLT